MGSVLHGNCLSVPNMHGHSHGGGHGHSHGGGSGCGGGAKATATTTPLSDGVPKKDDSSAAVLANGVINIHSTSIHTTHSRHNSFSKTLPNGGTLLDGSAASMLNEQSHSVPNLHRAASIDKSYAR